MLNRFIQLSLALCLITTPALATTNPFIGKWKIDPSKTKIYDELKVEATGPNKYTFTFGPGQIDTVITDGTDQPALAGTTLSVTVKGPNSWEVVRKIHGRTLLKAQWTLSAGGKTLDDAFTQYIPDGTVLFSQPMPSGSSLYMPYVYQRTAGTSGFPGTWDSDSAKASPRIELEVLPAEADGLSLKRSDEDTATKIKLDGDDHPDLDPTGADKGTTSSARRVTDHILELTEKSKGKLTTTRQLELSPDQKSLTITTTLPGQTKPQSIFVYDRE